MLRYVIPVGLCSAALRRCSPSLANPRPRSKRLSMQDSNLKPALPGALQGVGIDQTLDAQIPLDLTFTR